MKTKTFTIGLMLMIFCISLFAQEGDNYHKGVIHVKLTEAAVKSLESLHQQKGNSINVIKADKQAYVATQIKELDALNKQFAAKQYTRVFRYAGKFEEKHKAFGLHLWYTVTFDTKASVDEIVKSYKALGTVKHCNAIPKSNIAGRSEQLKLSSTNDPRFKDQWHYENTGQSGGTKDADIDLLDAWQVETGDSRVIVAVEDAGIDYNHEDLSGNMWKNPGETPGNGKDDDNNGYVDDYYGYNFCDNTGTIVVGNHATHVAGTIAAETNNGIGVSGIAGGTGNNDGVRLMSCVIYSGNSEGGQPEAPVYAADMGAAISQNSWNYSNIGSFDQPVLDAIDYFKANGGGSAMQGGLTIFSSGNKGTSGKDYPAYYSTCFAVASTDDDDKKASDSNYGDWIEVAAPGVNVLSTYPNNSYGNMSGTSMACPHVSGIAALVVSQKYGNITNSELWDILTSGVDDVGDSRLGSGRINAFKCLDGNLEPNVNPVAEANGPYSGETGQAIQFSSTGSKDSDGSISSYLWDFGDGASSSEVNPKHTYTTNGNFTAKLTVTDNRGGINSDNASVSITGDPLKTVGETRLLGQITDASNRRAMQYKMPENGTITSISQYHKSGSGKMYLAIYDGTSSAPNKRIGFTESTQVSSADGWQTINLISPVTVQANQIIWLAWVYETIPGIAFDSGTPGRVDAGEGWSGGMPDPWGSTASQSDYIYSIYAIYTAGGSVNESPVAKANGTYSGKVNESIQFSSAGSSDSDGTIKSYLWNFGDGATSTNANPTHTYTTSGTFNVSLKVTDDKGASDTDNTTASITGGSEMKIVGETKVLGQFTDVANRRAMPFTMPESGIISSVSQYHKAGSGKMYLAVYDGTSSKPNNRIAVTNSTTVSGSDGWQTIELLSPIEVQANQTIWLAWVYETNPGIAFDSGSPGRVDAGVAWSGGMPESWGSTASSANYQYSIYASYTPITSNIITVGETNVLAQTTDVANRRAMPFTTTGAGTLTSISQYHNGGSGNMYLAIYDETSSKPNNRIGVTALTSVNSTTGWQTIELVSPVEVQANQTIWLAWVYESNPGIAFDSGTPGRVDAGTAWTGGMPASWGSTASSANYKYSIYATYSKSNMAGNPDIELSNIDISEPSMNAYPSPFSSETNISIDLPLDEMVQLKIYNSTGQLVRTLVSGTTLPSGNHKFSWNGCNDSGGVVLNGIYIIQLRAGNNNKTQRVLLLK